MNLCVIPARGGSKRIPRRNITLFCGKPITAYSIETALDSNLFDEVMVSTDDDEIASVATQYGARVPFLRSESNSNDYAGVSEVVLEVLQWYMKEEVKYDLVCCIFATAPFISAELVAQTYEKLIKGLYDSVFPVVRFD